MVSWKAHSKHFQPITTSSYAMVTGSKSFQAHDYKRQCIHLFKLTRQNARQMISSAKGAGKKSVVKNPTTRTSDFLVVFQHQPLSVYIHEMLRVYRSASYFLVAWFTWKSGWPDTNQFTCERERTQIKTNTYKGYVPLEYFLSRLHALVIKSYVRLAFSLCDRHGSI